MSELTELQNQLAALRREAAALLREGCTRSQVLKLRRDLVRLWAAIEDHKHAELVGPERGRLH
jgi:hypothetical protein